MTRTEQVRRLMVELGPSSPEITNVTQITEDTFAIGHVSGIVVLVQLDEESGRFILRAGVGRPKDGQRAKLYEVLLAYNALWRDTGGVTMAAVNGEVVQIHAVDADSLDVAGLATLLSGFAMRAHVWRRAIQLDDALLSPAGLLPGGVRA